MNGGVQWFLMDVIHRYVEEDGCNDDGDENEEVVEEGGGGRDRGEGKGGVGEELTRLKKYDCGYG